MIVVQEDENDHETMDVLSRALINKYKDLAKEYETQLEHYYKHIDRWNNSKTLHDKGVVILESALNEGHKLLIKQKQDQINTMTLMLNDSKDYYNEVLKLKNEILQLTSDRNNSVNEIVRVNNINKLLLEQIEEHNAVITVPPITNNNIIKGIRLKT
jgi:exonuclease VII large subunit